MIVLNLFYFNIGIVDVNEVSAEKSARCKWVLVLIELAVSGTQCIK